MVSSAALSIVILPLLSAIINGLFGKCLSKKQAGIVAGLSMLLASLSALFIFYYVGINRQVVHITVIKRLDVNETKVNWALYIDQLTAIMFIVVTWVSTIV